LINVGQLHRDGVTDDTAKRPHTINTTDSYFILLTFCFHADCNYTMMIEIMV